MSIKEGFVPVFTSKMSIQKYCCTLYFTFKVFFNGNLNPPCGRETFKKYINFPTHLFWFKIFRVEFGTVGHLSFLVLNLYGEAPDGYEVFLNLYGSI